MNHIQDFDPLQSPDVIDQASNLDMRNRAAAEQAVRSQVAPEKFPDGKGGFIEQKARPGADPEVTTSYPIQECVACDDPIPLLRLKMGRIRCTGCQERKENPRKR